jgi:hypothetical protein
LADGGNDFRNRANVPRAEELYSDAMQIDRGKPGRPGSFDARAKFFPAFAVLNPSLLTALELRPRRAGVSSGHNAATLIYSA